MADLPTNEYVELREGAYYVVGTRIGLDVIIYASRRGKTPEGLLEAYPSLRSMEKVQAVLAFIQDHPDAIETYLQDQEIAWEQFRKEHPIPEDMLRRLQRAREERRRRSA